MESNHELKEFHIKNCTCYCFNETMRDGDSNFDNILLDKESHVNWNENILIYTTLYKTFIGAKPLRIRFNEVDGFSHIFDGTRYLALIIPERYDAIYDRIRYLTVENSGITYSISHNFARIRIDSYNSSPVTLTFHNVIIFIRSIVNKNKKNYYYNIFLEKGSYEDKVNTKLFKWMFLHCKCYISIKMTFLKGLILVKQVNKKSEIFVTIGIF